MGPPPPLDGSSASPPSQDPSGQPTSPSQKESWISVVRAAPTSVSQFQPELIVSNGVARISIPDELIVDAMPLWKSFVVGHFMGDIPHVGTIHATVNRIWTIQEKSSRIDVQIINKTTVLFRIASSRIRERVLKRKYWHIADIPLVVSEWNPEASTAPLDLTAMPMWIDLQGVPGFLFSQRGLEFLSSTVGKFVKLHPNTERCIRLDVARILVEVNLQKPLTEKISFTDVKGKEILVSVSYPWLPPKCKVCSLWGHKENACTASAKVKFAPPCTVSNDSGKASLQENADSTTVHQMTQNLLRDLELSIPCQLSGSARTDSPAEAVAPTANKETDSQWTLVTNLGNVSHTNHTVRETTVATQVSPTGFRVLQIEGDDEVSDVQPQQTATINSSSLARVEDKEEGEVVESDQEDTMEAEKHENDSTPVGEDDLAGVIPNQNPNLGRHRSRSKGAAKPITQRKDAGSKGTKKTSSRKL